MAGGDDGERWRASAIERDRWIQRNREEQRERVGESRRLPTTER